jgi:Rieske Fe-S protein
LKTGGGGDVAAWKHATFSQKCTHLSCAVVPRLDQNILHCPCHEGVFDLRSGRPTAGPPRRPLSRVALDVRGDDVFATDVETRMV